MIHSDVVFGQHFFPEYVHVAWNIAISLNAVLVLCFGFVNNLVLQKIDSIISILAITNLKSTSVPDGRVIHLLLSEFKAQKGV